MSRSTLRTMLGATALVLVIPLLSGQAGAAPPVEPPDPGDPQPCTVYSTSPPTVSADPKVGVRSTGTKGTWEGDTNTTTFDYSWWRGTTQISGATGLAYTPVPADVGHQLQLKVRATGLSVCLDSVDTESARTAAVLKGDAPTVTAWPRITGEWVAGATVTASTGTWSYQDGGQATSYHYTWFRNGVALTDPVPGPTATSYVLTTADQGQSISVQVIAKRDGWSDGSRHSPTYVVPWPHRVENITPPTVTGGDTVGSVLTLDPGTWSPATGLTLSVQWCFYDRVNQVDGCDPADGDGRTYTLREKHIGYEVYAYVVGQAPDHQPYEMSSNSIGPVKAAPVVTQPPATPTLTWTGKAPRIKGKARVGSRLRLSLSRKKLLARFRGDGVTADTVRYQWYRGKKAIKKATKATYRLRKGDKRKKIRVRITGHRTGYESATVWTRRVRIKA